MDKGCLMAKRYAVLKEPLVYHKKIFSKKADLALLMIEKWGMVQGFPDGEDSAGRAKLGLMPIDKLIERAFNCADEAFKEIEKRGWSMEVPPPEIDNER